MSLQNRATNWVCTPNINAQLPMSSSDINNVTETNLTILYPVNVIRYYINPSNGFGSGTVDNLKNETKFLTTAELYPSASYGKVYTEVFFNTTGIDLSAMTIFRINWEASAVSTASNPLITKVNVFIDKSGMWQLLHNATNTGGYMIDKKIGYADYNITSDFLTYVTGNTIKLKFEAEVTLTSTQSNWYLYLIQYWVNIIFGKNIEFARINASSIILPYNDSQYEQIGSMSGLTTDEDSNILAIKLNQPNLQGRNNITFDINFNLGTFSLDDIYGFSYYHDDWYLYGGGSPSPETGTIKIQNCTSHEYLPILNVRTPHISYAGLYPKHGHSGYVVPESAWWTGSDLALRYYQNVTGATDWVKIEIDLGYIEIVKRISPIFSVSFENTTKYIDEIEYLNIYVENYKRNVTDIRIINLEGEVFINNTEGNYTFEITRSTASWYNFSVQIIDNEDHLVTKGIYCIKFSARPVQIDIALAPFPRTITMTLHITDLITDEPIPNKQFDLLIFRYGETIPYQSYPGLTTNSSGMYGYTYTMFDYLDKTYTFNVTTYADSRYEQCSVINSVTCSYAPPVITITNVVYNSQYAGETATIYYYLEDWTVPIAGIIFRQNGETLASPPLSPGSYQLSFKTITGNNNYSFWALNMRGQIGESEIINFNLNLMPIKMDTFSFYIDNLYYFYVNIMDNATGNSIDGVPVQLSIYDGGFLMFTGTVMTHSVIFGGFPFDKSMDHHFLLKAEITSSNYVNLQREAQLPYKTYPLKDFIYSGIFSTTIILAILLPFYYIKRRKTFKKRRRRQ